MKRFLQTGNVVSFLVMLVLNYLSNTGVFNGNTMASVSAEYQNLFTPAGFAFSIWGLIYVGLLAFVIYQGRSLFQRSGQDDFVTRISGWFIVSCLANSFWVLAWLYEYTGTSVLIMIILLFSLLRIILNLNMELDDVPVKKIAFVWWPFSIYSGWITVALIANIAAWLTKIGWDGFGVSDVSWTIIMICIATGINLSITWTRNMREFAMVAVWALIAIAFSNRHNHESIYLTALIAAGIITLSTSFHAYQNRKNLYLRFIKNQPVDEK
jgi:hypothetical protein